MARRTHKILFLNSIEETVWGGLENWMEMCGKGLADHGHEVCFAGRKNSKYLKRVAQSTSVEILPLRISGDFCPSTIRDLARYFRKSKTDVVLCNFVKDVRLAGMARKFAGPCKIIWTPGVNLARKSVSHRLVFSGYVDRAIVPSSALRDEIVESGYIESSKFDVIPIGIDPSLWQGDRETGRRFLRERFDLPEEAFVCLTSGRFVKQKGHRYLIEAASELARKHDDIYFCLLGDGPLLSELQESIAQLNLTERFVFCGLLANHQPAVFGTDLYVHPAIIEPFGIVLVEAMAAALPVVASRVGGIGEVVTDGETGILVEAGNPAQLTKAIEELYTDRTRRNQYGEAGYRRYDEKFSMETMIDRVEKSIVEAVGA